ncbi:MAG: hypothetical protein IJ308_04020 [Clostridia bacterium]|nr:hypothetical protein [Clostridia bacterium]
MKRTITIKGREGRFDEPSFLISDNESLTIKFSFPSEIRTRRYRVVIRHGAASKMTVTLGEERSVTLSPEWLKEGGTEPVEFSLVYLNANATAVIKDDYLIEPLKIQRVDGNFAYTAVISDLCEKVAVLEDLYRKELAAKEKILVELKEYVDNGAELVPEEIE